MSHFTDQFKLFFSSVWTFIEPFVEILLTSAGQILVTTAMDAVTQVAKDPSLLTSADKRSAAFALIIQNLEAQGIQLATSTINAALEASVVKMKAGAK